MFGYCLSRLSNTATHCNWHFQVFDKGHIICLAWLYYSQMIVYVLFLVYHVSDHHLFVLAYISCWEMVSKPSVDQLSSKDFAWMYYSEVIVYVLFIVYPVSIHHLFILVHLSYIIMCHIPVESFLKPTYVWANFMRAGTFYITWDLAVAPHGKTDSLSFLALPVCLIPPLFNRW